MLFQRRGQLRPFSFLNRDKVLDGHCVQHLTAEALGCHAGADAFTRSINGRCCTGRAAADHQHVKGFFGADFFGLALNGAGVELAQNLFQAHAALAKVDTIKVDAGHRHHLTFGDFVLEQGAVNRHMANVRVQHGHQVQRLHNVRAVLAGQREIGLEVELAFKGANLFNHFGTGFRWVAADLQQGQHQRRKFVAHGDACKTQADIAARAVQRERRLARIVTVVQQGDHAGKAGDFF